jgi:TonB family protein
MNFRAACLVFTGVLTLCAVSPAFGAPADTPMLRCPADGIVSPTPQNSHTAAVEDYPLLSVTLGEQGRTILEFVVTEAGTVANPRVLVSSGYPRLDDAAAELAKTRWRYNPATRRGVPVSCLWKASVDWRLSGGQFSLPPDSPYSIMTMKPEDYTADLRQRGAQGAVVLGFTIGEDGKVLTSQVVWSSGDSGLVAQSEAIATQRFRFKPAELSGKSVKTVVVVAMVWSLGAPPEKK